MKTQCLLFSGVNLVTQDITELRPPTASEVLIETEISCVSPGTELRCLAGQEIALGDRSYPFIPGYAAVGRVIGPEEGAGQLMGRRVFCSGNRGTTSHLTAWGGHTAHIVARRDAIVPLPDAISSRDAALLKLAAIAYRGSSIAPPAPRSTVLVVGLGPIGQLSARCYAAAGARVLAVDIRPDRVAIARRAGIDALLAKGDLVACVRTRLPTGAAIVVDATGLAALLPQTAALVEDKPWDESAAPGGRLVVQGSYGSPVQLPPEICFARELAIVWPRDSQQRDVEAVLGLLAAGKISFDGLLDGVYPVGAAPGIYQAFQDKTLAALTVGFSWKHE